MVNAKKARAIRNNLLSSDWYNKYYESAIAANKEPLSLKEIKRLAGKKNVSFIKSKEFLSLIETITFDQ